ncbi:MAG: PAS domain-containing protein [Acidobacteriota bacterium]
MSQKDIEIILSRQLASYLATPIFLVDTEGNLIFYNEPAEEILGRRFEETGEMPAYEWSTIFTPTGEDGAPLPPGELPLMIALTDHKPSYKKFWIRGLDGVLRNIEVTAFPLLGQGERNLGAVAIFWESSL